ncbi:ABC transporter substrate-binding protein [bacterium]|nr:ABC transporter substrate-binding protein [bacterium]
MSRNLVQGLVSLMLAALWLQGCELARIFGPRKPQKAKAIEFWHSMTGDKSQVLTAIVDEYNGKAADSGNLPVKLQFTGTYADGINKLRLAVMAKRPPHLAQIYEIGTQQLVDSGGVIPLADLIGDDTSFGLDQMLPQVTGYYRINGRLYSLPFATSNPVIYANGDALAAAGLSAPPATFDELESVCARLADPAAGRSCLAMPLTSWIFEQALARQGALFLDHDNGRSAVATAAVYDGIAGQFFLDWLGRLSRAGLFSNTGRSWDPPVENFMAGRSALLITSTSDVFVLGQRAKFPVIVGPFPAPSAAVSDPASAAPNGGTVLGGNSIWALRGRPQAEMRQAYEFLKYLASAGVQRRWHVNTGYFPIRRDVIDALDQEGFYSEHPNARVAVDQLLAAPDTAAARGAISGVFPELREHVENAMEETLSGNGTSIAALRRARDKSTRALQRYKKLL